MDYLEKYAQERLEKLKGMRRQCVANLKGLPEGKVYVKKKRKTNQFYKITPDGDRNGKYIKAGERDVAESLVKREYNEKCLKEIEKEIRALEKMLKTCNSENLENVISKLAPVKQTMVMPLVLPREDFIKQWEEEKQQLKEKMWSMVMKSYDESMDDEEGVFTEKDEKVRSKSEKIIADKLNLMGIPYIYELPLHLDGLGYIKPDFTALNPDTREECIWEHFEMMENPEYASKAMNKLNVYARNGYTVGDNLIITMEGQSQPLNTRNLDKVIRKNLMT